MNDSQQLEDSALEYFNRVKERVNDSCGVCERTAQAWLLAQSAEQHFARIELPYRRYLRACEQHSLSTQSYERRLILALLYEILDTICMVFGMLDFDALDLISASDGVGLAGEHASDVVRTLKVLNDQAERLLAYERRLLLSADFTVAVDEQEGLTYRTHRHWQDFVPGSVCKSFNCYFAKVQRVIAERLRQQPSFWEHQTVSQYLLRAGYVSLQAILHRLEAASLDAEFAEDDELTSETAGHHWGFDFPFMPIF